LGVKRWWLLQFAHVTSAEAEVQEFGLGECGQSQFPLLLE
jgi:hypothetical protein